MLEKKTFNSSVVVFHAINGRPTGSWSAAGLKFGPKKNDDAFDSRRALPIPIQTSSVKMDKNRDPLTFIHEIAHFTNCEFSLLLDRTLRIYLKREIYERLN